MEVLSPAEIVVLSEKEKTSLQLPQLTEVPVIPFKEDKKQNHPGALFQKTCSSCPAASKYQCPKCSTLSCSVACVNKHKIEEECDGIRNKTTFVAVEDFKDVHLHNDYHFLEDVQRQIDIVSRAKRSLGRTHGDLPYNLHRLQVAAKERKTDLHILPLFITKRKRSTTYFRYSDRRIFWRLEWEFLHSNFTCYDERVDEDSILQDCINKYVDKSSVDANENLSYYHELEPQNIVVLLRDEKCPANVTQYHILEKKLSLKSNFKHKKIIEFPTLLVISKVHLASFQIAV